MSEEPLCADDNCPSAVSCWRYMRNFYTETGRRVWTDFEREPEAVGCEAYQPFMEKV